MFLCTHAFLNLSHPYTVEKLQWSIDEEMRNHIAEAQKKFEATANALEFKVFFQTTYMRIYIYIYIYIYVDRGTNFLLSFLSWWTEKNGR